MAPNTENKDIIAEDFHVHDFSVEKIGTDLNYRHQIVWPVAIAIGIIQICGAYGWYLLLNGICMKYTTIYAFAVGYLLGAPSVVIGAHRMYTHRTLKAVWPLRLLLLAGFTMLGQNSMYTWVRDHRLHHKYTDTDADPHNVKRGLFFAHMGWLMCKKHPLVKEKGKVIYLGDLEADPMIMFHKKYFPYLYVLSIATLIFFPMYLWGECFMYSFFVPYAAAYFLSLHSIWTINSLAHFFGTQPYDKTIEAVDNWVVHVLTWGEGMHNYHHTFPWDYRSSTTGVSQWSLTTMLIEILSLFGLIYDRKWASHKLIAQRARKTGDGSYRPKLMFNQE